MVQEKVSFARPLLPFGKVREAFADCTHLQVALTDSKTKTCKRVQFLHRSEYSNHIIKYTIKDKLIMRIHFYLILILITSFTGCKNRNERLNSSEIKEQTKNQMPTLEDEHETFTESKIEKAIFFLENSGSMKGYVNGNEDFKTAITALVHLPNLDSFEKKFYFINGKDTDIQVQPIQDFDRNGLDAQHYKKSYSDLTKMFEVVLDSSKNKTITFLITDGLYDVGESENPIKALEKKIEKTQETFRKILNSNDIQTLIVKAYSNFNGPYSYATKGVSEQIDQPRPYYIFIFGKSKFLNDLKEDDLRNKIKNYSDIARFLKLSELEAPYQATAHKKVGDFRFDKRDKNKLVSIKTDRHGQGFQFTMAVDYSELPFSESYLTSTSNYSCNNSNFSIRDVYNIGDVKLYGLDFEPTHLIIIGTERSPHCQLEISLQNNVPNWIENTNSDDESNIIGDTTHTFGFKFLTDAISEAYQYKNNESNIVTFKIELIK